MSELELKVLSRAELGFWPTPFYKLENFSRELGVNVYIKRDDFTGMSLFGGNKVRKLEYVLGQAAKDGCEYAITYGATQSNHAMETAACARRLGMQPILYLTAVVEPDRENVKGNLVLDRILGAEIHIVDILPGETEEMAEERSFRMGAARAEELRAAGHPTVDIPMGGATTLGSVGFAYGYQELCQQIEAMGLDISAIYHATGTGGTMAGLHAGRTVFGGNMDIVSITVSLKGEPYLDKVEALTNSVMETMGADLKVDRSKLHIDNGYYAPGYEQPNEMASEAIKLLARTEGLFVDPVYTGKALAGLVDHAGKGIIKPGSNVVFWHTGGATALFAEQEILGDIL